MALSGGTPEDYHRKGFTRLIDEPLEDLSSSPSRLDGISREEERHTSYKAIKFINECGVHLKLPQIVVATAAILFHRICRRKSQAKLEVLNVAAACIFLSTKIEETPRRLRDIINVSLGIQNRNTNRIAEDKEYWDTKGKLIHFEQMILRELSFSVDIQHPYIFLLNYTRSLRCSKSIIQVAWSLVNDTLYSIDCLTFPSYVIAITCIFVAAQLTKEEETLPQGRWWYIMDTSDDDLEMLSRLIFENYDKNFNYSLDATSSEASNNEELTKTSHSR